MMAAMTSPPSAPRSTATGSGLARSSAAMASGTLVSRVLGMVRGILLAAVMGLGLTGSTFTVANTLPNNLYQLIAGGILGAILVPQIAKAASHDDGGDDFVNRLLTLSITLMAVATVVATALAPFLVRLYASSKWGGQELALSTTFAVICLPQIFFYGLTALLGQVLNARGHFAAYMWTPVLANVIAIGGLLAFLARHLPRNAAAGAWTPQMVWLVAGTTTLGIAVQGLFLFIPLRRSGFHFRPTWGFRGVGLGAASRVAAWSFAAVGASQLGYVVTSQVLTHADKVAEIRHVQSAGQAVYANAFLLFGLPHSMITMSLVTALFTRLSYSAQAGRTEDVLHDFRRGLRMPAVLLVPITVGGVLLAPLATRVIFFGSARAGTDAIARVMAAMLLGLVPYGWNYLVQRVFYVYEDARTPFWLTVAITVVATGVNLVALTLPPQWVGVGVGIGQSLSNALGAGLGFWLLRRRFGALHLGPTIRQNVRILMSSLVAGALTWPVVLGIHAGLGQAYAGAAVALVVGGTFFFVVALLMAARLRVHEVHDLLAPVVRRLPGPVSRLLS